MAGASSSAGGDLAANDALAANDRRPPVMLLPPDPELLKGKQAGAIYEDTYIEFKETEKLQLRVKTVNQHPSIYIYIYK